MPLEQSSNQTITFDGNFRLCLMPPFFIGISTIYCPHSDHFESYRDIINVKELLIRKENSHGVLFSKICSNPICKCFSVWSFEHRKAMVRLLSYRDVAPRSFFIIRRTLLSEIRSSINSPRADTLFFRRKRYFTFLNIFLCSD